LGRLFTRASRRPKHSLLRFLESNVFNRLCGNTDVDRIQTFRATREVVAVCSGSVLNVAKRTLWGIGWAGVINVPVLTVHPDGRLTGDGSKVAQELFHIVFQILECLLATALQLPLMLSSSSSSRRRRAAASALGRHKETQERKEEGSRSNLDHSTRT